MALNNYDIWQRAIPVPLNTLAFLAWMIKLRTPGKKIDLAFWNKKIEDRFDFLELKFEDKSGKRIEYSTYIWNKFYNNACLCLKIGFLTCSILRTLENMTHHFFTVYIIVFLSHQPFSHSSVPRMVGIIWKKASEIQTIFCHCFLLQAPNHIRVEWFAKWYSYFYFKLSPSRAAKLCALTFFRGVDTSCLLMQWTRNMCISWKKWSYC